MNFDIAAAFNDHFGMSRRGNLLTDQLGPARQRRRIAIVTLDFVGPVKNGGIGTAYTCLAIELVRAGHDVTVFFANPTSPVAQSEFGFWKRHYAKMGIRLESLKPPRVPAQWDAGDYFGFGAPLAYSVYENLKTRKFDIVHFPENGGLGYFCMLAKKTGVAFKATLFCVMIHSPVSWQREYNSVLEEGVGELQLAFLERRSAELADVVVGPSQYILDWVSSRGWKLPKRTFVEQYIFPEEEPSNRVSPKATNGRFDEIVLFGRIEPRKGIENFLEAISRLPSGFMDRRKAVFLGSYALSAFPWAQEKFARSLEKTRFKWQLIRNYGREEALQYLKSRNVLVVIPSVAENLAFTAIECLQHSIPFIASDVPALRELVHPKDHDSVFFRNRPEELAAKIELAAREGAPSGTRFAVPPSQTRSRWIEWHSRVRIAGPAELKTSAKKSRQPRITVCLLHHDRPRFLKMSLQSLEKQKYRSFDVLVVDNASETAKARTLLQQMEPKLRKRGWKLLRLAESLSPSEARNKAARAARGEYILFMDDDNLADPRELEVFAQAAANTGADILTCFCDRFGEDEQGTKAPTVRWLATGDDLATALFYNVVGDMNALIRKKTFVKLGGFKWLEQAGHEDWEFFVRAVLSGARLMTIPEALFRYRRHSGSRTRSIDPYQSARLHLSGYRAMSSSFPELLPLLGAAFTMQRKIRAIEPPRDVEVRDYSRAFFDPRHSFTQELFSSEGRSRVARLPRSAGWIELPSLRIPRQDILLEITLTSSHSGALRISYQTDADGSHDSRVIVRSVRVGKNRVHALLDGREIRSSLKILPLDQKAKCSVEGIAIYTEEPVQRA